MSKSTYIILSVIAITVGTFINYAQVGGDNSSTGRGYGGGSYGGGYSGSGGHK